MKKQALKVFVISGFFALLMSAPAYAQSDERVIADIPFAFVVGDETLPAGEYVIKQGITNSPDVLLIRGEDNSNAVFVMAQETQATRTPDKTELVFNEIGNTYFLSKIWVAGDDMGRELPKTSAERAMEQGESQHLSKAVTVTTCRCDS
ncbi:MAG: hypothetical protein AB7U82_17240 [Blastocatellales bacterium]